MVALALSLKLLDGRLQGGEVGQRGQVEAALGRFVELVAEDAAEAFGVEALLALEIEVKKDIGVGGVEVAAVYFGRAQMPQERGFADAALADDGDRLGRGGVESGHDALDLDATAEKQLDRAQHRAVEVGVA